MKRNKNFDFVLQDDGEFGKIIFRFDPKNTHVHSFNDKPPKTWKEVYKVYYSYKIFKQYFDDAGKLYYTRVLYDMPCDECSEIPNLSNAIKYLIDNKIENEHKEIDLNAFGQPATDWNLKLYHYNLDEKIIYGIKFMIWDSFYNTGYKIYLDESKCREFAKYLDFINEYALKHGEEI